MRHSVGDCPRRSPQHTTFDPRATFVARFCPPVIVGLSAVGDTPPYSSCQLHWRREDIIELTEVYKDSACLWEVKHHLHKDRNAVLL